MMYARFREMPDGTVLVVSDHGLWFHQNDPEVVQRFHQMVEQERKYIADNPPSSASLGDDIDNAHWLHRRLTSPQHGRAAWLGCTARSTAPAPIGYSA